VKFISISVGKGDAFYLEKNNKSLLFDGGSGVVNFPTLFMNETNVKKLNYLICSHNDSDHANGILGLLKDQSIICDEVWLPGSWTTLLKKLLAEPIEFYRKLCGEILELDTDESTLEACSEDLSDAMFNGNKYESIENKELFENANNVIKIDPSSTLNMIIGTQVSKKDLMLDAIKAMERVRKIALEANKRGVKIRWFEFITDPLIAPVGGDPDILEPVNCTELKQPKFSDNITCLRYATLSVENKRSLVFHSPKKGNDKGSVLFTADSDLLFCSPVPLDDNMLVTIPHHGANSSHAAYNEFGKLKNPVFIRSDKFNNPNKPNHPFSTYSHYMSFNVGVKRCTLCLGDPKSNKKSVYFSYTNNSWISSSALCSC